MKRFLTLTAIILAVAAAIQVVGPLGDSNKAQASQAERVGGGVGGGGGTPGI